MNTFIFSFFSNISLFYVITVINLYQQAALWFQLKRNGKK